MEEGYTMTLEEMAKEKVYLVARLQAFNAMNTYGLDTTALITLEMDRIETSRRMQETNKAIQEYIEGKPCRTLS